MGLHFFSLYNIVLTDIALAMPTLKRNLKPNKPVLVNEVGNGDTNGLDSMFTVTLIAISPPVEIARFLDGNW
ncbi:hypothetical protein LOK49_LG05G01488 [Camellia lanceoleosa]|uniref:Uncharacterized protein n=1 Tax=Camellia lanceoleosa TaxID=1840588 RepID=A0ACC0HR92_9ERIC|nr:hypothetical protein LOK49_LG05G01488 [Camellia lanceoleosa]